jgi:uncharacterized membrane protein HdeD (DUF308 family)
MTAQAVRQEGPAMVPWWLVLLEGIALVILGILWLGTPAQTSIVLIQVLGIYWLIGGIFKIIAIFLDSSLWGWKLLAGVLGILAGLVVLNHPFWSPLVVFGTLVIVLGIQGIIYGAVGLYQAFKGAGWGTGILGGLSIIFGIYLLFNIGASTLVVPWVLSIFAIVGGIMSIIVAFRLR